MTTQQYFPAVLIVEYICASMLNAWGGDWRRSLYWLAAALISFVVTF